MVTVGVGLLEVASSLGVSSSTVPEGLAGPTQRLPLESKAGVTGWS